MEGPNVQCTESPSVQCTSPTPPPTTQRRAADAATALSRALLHKVLVRHESDLIKKGYGKQSNDILMNFSTQFEKPWYVNHSLQLPSRKHSGGSGGPSEVQTVLEERWPSKPEHPRGSALRRWSQRDSAAPNTHGELSFFRGTFQHAQMEATSAPLDLHL